MTFQIHGLPDTLFSHLFDLGDAELARHMARRMRADETPGFPCRVSLAEADVGEPVLLLNYEHQPSRTPYRASHAIFVRIGARQAFPEPGEVPEIMQRRLMGVRCFDSGHDMIDAEIVDGQDLAATISRLFDNAEVDYAHLHNAKRGCFAASVTRADR
jgi:hypothetical protein